MGGGHNMRSTAGVAMLSMYAGAGYPTGDELPVGPTEDLNEATRWMCSRVLVNRPWAENVYRRLCIPRIESLAPSPGIDLRALARHAAWAIHAEQRARTVASGLLVAAGLSALALSLGGSGWGWTAASASVFLFVAAVAAVVETRSSLARTARRVVGGGPVEVVGEGLVARHQLRRLEAANDGDLLVYSERRSTDEDPHPTVFPGFGHIAGHEVRLPVDVSQPLVESVPLGRVVPYKLLEHLADNVPHHIDRTALTSGCLTGVVAHVRSGDVSDLLEGPDGPVRSEPDSGLVRTVTDRPTRARRGYVRVQAVGHDGHLVTSLHLSAVVGTTGLSLNFIVHVLGPLPHAWAEARAVPATPWRRRRWVLRRQPIWRMVLGSLWASLRLWRLTRRAHRPARPERRTSGNPYAARGGLRQLVTGQALRFNEQVDLRRQGNDLMRAVFSEASAFLEMHNIDATGLREDEREVIQNVTNVIGAVLEGTVHVEGDLDASTRLLATQDLA